MEQKKNMLNSVKPPNSSTNFMNQAKPSNSILNNKYMDAYYKSKNSLNADVLEDKKYRINPNAFGYTGKTLPNQLPVYANSVVYMGGHFVVVPNGGAIVQPSGLSLTGGQPKVLSEKSKSILKYVFGIDPSKDVDESTRPPINE